MTTEVLLNELCEEKQLLIRKFRLVPKSIDGKTYWVRQFSNRPDHPYATHRAMRRCHVLELVFSFYDLCVAKMTYFRAHMSAYEACKNDLRNGELTPCALWDMEFLRHRHSNVVIDLRNLAEISDIQVFRDLCHWLEDHPCQLTA
ncbi:MAG: hypothetical protein JXR59_03465 [Desulfuromonadaceae bacterium]|nr:hypothetical protein [Desulfuromonadaceae bacterium]